jgi:hypothetical protein
MARGTIQLRDLTLATNGRLGRCGASTPPKTWAPHSRGPSRGRNLFAPVGRCQSLQPGSLKWASRSVCICAAPALTPHSPRGYGSPPGGRPRGRRTSVGGERTDVNQPSLAAPLGDCRRRNNTGRFPRTCSSATSAAAPPRSLAKVGSRTAWMIASSSRSCSLRSIAHRAQHLNSATGPASPPRTTARLKTSRALQAGPIGPSAKGRGDGGSRHAHALNFMLSV